MTDPADLGHALDPDESLEEGERVADEPSRMSFLDHLDELRRRIMYALYAVIGACVVTFYFWDQMFVYLATYFQQHGGNLIYTRPMGAFLFNMKVGALAGLLLASPFVFAQLWLFIAPGLYAREKRVVIPFVGLSSILFGGGAFFAHQVAFPAMWKFFASYAGLGGLQFFPTIDDTFAFYVKTIIGLGLIFQMPLLVYFLARFGIVSAGFMLRHYKYAVLIIVVLAAVITPSGDMVTLGVFAAPMLVLYGVSIGVAWIVGGRRRRDRDREDE
jgi:sec-independent protein translocase protein TatC